MCSGHLYIYFDRIVRKKLIYFYVKKLESFLMIQWKSVFRYIFFKWDNSIKNIVYFYKFTWHPTSASSLVRHIAFIVKNKKIDHTFEFSWKYDIHII